MKRIISVSLSFFLLASLSAPALAFDTPYSQGKIAPFNLVGLAYQGFFEEQGIPSAEALFSAYRRGEISAEDVVKGAIQANRLSSELLKDSNYISAVNSQLEALTRGSN